jgi:hypothetical protein
MRRVVTRGLCSGGMVRRCPQDLAALGSSGARGLPTGTSAPRSFPERAFGATYLLSAGPIRYPLIPPT